MALVRFAALPQFGCFPAVAFRARAANAAAGTPRAGTAVSRSSREKQPAAHGACATSHLPGSDIKRVAPKPAGRRWGSSLTAPASGNAALCHRPKSRCPARRIVPPGHRHQAVRSRVAFNLVPPRPPLARPLPLTGHCSTSVLAVKGSLAPRSTCAPLTAPGRREERSTGMRERGLPESGSQNAVENVRRQRRRRRAQGEEEACSGGSGPCALSHSPDPSHDSIDCCSCARSSRCVAAGELVRRAGR